MAGQPGRPHDVRSEAVSRSYVHTQAQGDGS
jgi:hypothetical protein